MYLKKMIMYICICMCICDVYVYTYMCVCICIHVMISICFYRNFGHAHISANCMYVCMRKISNMSLSTCVKYRCEEKHIELIGSNKMP